MTKAASVASRMFGSHESVLNKVKQALIFVLGKANIFVGS
jgi:hypothetical protein